MESQLIKHSITISIQVAMHAMLTCIIASFCAMPQPSQMRAGI